MKVLRMGHRAGRDERISTHVGLVARQYGVEEVVFTGQEDSSILDSLEEVNERWGDGTEYRYSESWKREIKRFEGFKLHLTMYGLPIDEKIAQVKQMDLDEIQVIIGSEKVPRQVYRRADLNMAVGNQPHSEIAALAVFLDRITQLRGEFENADIEVKPSDGEKITREF